MDRTALARATEGSDAPTPGYLYVDIAKSVASNPTGAREMVQYLTKRLQKNNHNVKFKCLKVITKTSESPITRGQFKRAICQDPATVGLIKQALQFRGPPDPVRGDEIYVRVRAAAKECLDAVYSDNPSSEGVGSGSYGGSYSSGGGGRMEGIGNPNFSDPRLEQSKNHGISKMTIGEAASSMGQTIVGMIKDPLAKNVQIAPSTDQNRSGNNRMQGFGSNSGSYGGYPPPPGRAELANQTGGQWTMASNRGPNAVAPSNYSNDKDSSYFKAREASSNAFQWAKNEAEVPSAPVFRGVGGSWAQQPQSAKSTVASTARANPQQSFAPATIQSAMGDGGAAAQDGTYERNIILELCPPGGLKPEPPQDKLEAFVQSISSLEADLICPPLLDSLEDGQPWIKKAKALCVIETTLIAANKLNQNNAYNDFFYENKQEVEPLASHNRSAIRDPALRVLKLLGANTNLQPTAVPDPPSQPPPPPPVSVNLLDFDDDDTLTSQANVAPLPANAPSTSINKVTSSLFGGLNIQSTPAPTADTQNLKDGAAETVEHEKPQFFDGATIKTDTAAPKLQDNQLESNGKTQSTPSTSAFGFLNATASVDETKTVANNSSSAPNNVFNELLELGVGPSEVAPAPPPQTKQSFDPLHASNSIRHTSTNSKLINSQMSAIAYQQNMMLMQQQMQQMQIALALQQQKQPTAGITMNGSSFVNPSSPTNSKATGNMARKPNVMAGNTMRQIPIVGAPPGTGRNSFSFLDNPGAIAKKDLKTFDFIKDTMKSAK